MAPNKRIALFLDGTWNSVSDNTNVWRLSSLCSTDTATGAEEASPQRKYYDQGVGTLFGQKLLGGAFGYGLDDEIILAYEWLIENHVEGDEVFIFGFSRGAYTARSLSGFIAKCGLLQPGAALAVSQLYGRYRRGNQVKTIRELKDANPISLSNEERWILEYSKPIDIKFLGVWDTVGALGIPFGNTPFSRSSLQFLDTNLRIENGSAYHALAIDEHRHAFAPTLWTYPRNFQPDRTFEQVEQRWFVGAHANVGGGCQDDLLAQIPLKWLMTKAADHGLRLVHDVQIDGDENKTPISDSYGEFLYGAYRMVSRKFFRPIGVLPTQTGPTINESIDASVFDRWRNDANYRPPNLQEWAQEHKTRIETLQFSVSANDASIVLPDASLPTPRGSVSA